MERRERGSRAQAAGVVRVGTFVLMTALQAGAQAPLPDGAEFQVNTYTTSAQRFPHVAAAANADFVVVWDSFVSPTDPNDSIQGQRYASDGTPLGDQIQVNAYTTNSQTLSSVASDPDGDFVVVWTSLGPRGTDSYGYSIQGRRFASDGTALDDQFQVNSYTGGSEDLAAAAMEADGGFVVVWRSLGSPGTDFYGYSIQGRRFGSDGTALNDQFQVNTYTTGRQDHPSVAVDSDGDFVVVWQSRGSFNLPAPDGSDASIQGRRYASDGVPRGPEFQVNAYTPAYELSPSVATEADGDFHVAWTSVGSLGPDTSGGSIESRRFGSDGTAIGTEFQINDHTTGDQSEPSLTMEPDGDFVVAWMSNGSAGTDTSLTSIQARRFASDGTADGPGFQVNTDTESYQRLPSVATGADGGFVVVWDSFVSYVDLDIRGQRFSRASTTTSTTSTTTTSTTSTTSTSTSTTATSTTTSSTTTTLETDRVTICHEAGKRGVTIEIHERALRKHLRHGDRVGACGTLRIGKGANARKQARR